MDTPGKEKKVQDMTDEIMERTSPPNYDRIKAQTERFCLKVGDQI